MTKRMLICDLDDTLYNWKGYFVSSFYAMVDRAVEILDCDRDELLNDFKQVHQKHQDSEHPFALLQTATVLRKFGSNSLAEKAALLDDALHAFNSSRKRNLKLYPGVSAGLHRLFCSNVVIVAHTESKLYGAIDRLDRFDLMRYFKRIYCRERADVEHPHPARAKAWLDALQMDKVAELSLHQRKPDMKVLKEICSKEGFAPEDCVYVGDSIARDMLMAKDAGVFAIWAKYGTLYDQTIQDRLVRVTHWTNEDVVREERLRILARDVEPDFVLEQSFAEIFDAGCFN